MSVEVLAESASAVAFVVGQAVHHGLSYIGQQESQPLIDQLGAPFLMEAGTELQIEQNQRFSVATRAVVRLLAADALLLTVTVGAGILGFSPEHSSTIKPIEIAVDHSGQTAHPRNGEPTIDKINNVLSQFNDGKAEVRAYVSSLGKVEETSHLEPVLKQTDSIGASDLGNATTQALNTINDIYNANNLAGQKRTGAVVVITNGQSSGDPNTLIKQAKISTTPIFVVNVPSKNGSSEAAGELKKLASVTGGKYWEVTNKTPNVAKVVEDSITGYEPKHNGSGNQNLLKILSVVTGLGAVAAFSKTRYPWQGASSKARKAS